jgi:serine/threonine-protein kinase
MLYEMVAGRPPFVAESPVALALAHIREDPRPLDQVAEGVPPNIASASMAALAKDPAERPPSAAAFASMLREPTLPTPSIAALEETTQVAPVAPGPEETTQVAPVIPGPEETVPLSPVRHPGDRRRILIPAVLIAAVLLLILAILMIQARDRSILQQARREARVVARVTVPELSGTTLSEAQDALEEVGLGVGDIRPRPGEAGIVIRSDPPAGERVRRDASITLIVGTSTRQTDNPKKHHDNGKHKGEEKND